LVTLPAGPATFTVSEIGLPAVPAAIEAAVVQVAVWPLPLQLHPLPLAALYVSPAGSVSTIVIVPKVAAVPVLLTAMAYVPGWPIVNVPLCVLATASTGLTIVAGLLATGVLLAPPPDALALFVSVAGAFAATFTVREMGLALAEVAMTVELVHVTTWPAAEQLQPVPLAAL
jgi:hypothetical protein